MEMNNEQVELLFAQLRAIRGEIAGVAADVRELKTRMSYVEIALVSVQKEIALQGERIAHQWTIFDQHNDRLRALETQAGLIHEPGA